MSVKGSRMLVAASVFFVVLLAAIPLSAAMGGSKSLTHQATGLGSCTLKGWNPAADPEDAKHLPIGQRPQTYRPDNYDCSGAKFAPPGVEFAKFPQPHDLAVTNREVTKSVLVCTKGVCHPQMTSYYQPVSMTQIRSASTVQSPSAQTAAANPLAPYFPPFTHFVILYRENHTFDDYLGDCATTVIAGCNGQVESTNHISSVPNLHSLAKTYALDDAYSTGTQPPSGPNHWWLFSAQSSSSSQQQSYPASTGTQFDRFLNGNTAAAQGTSACTTQTNTGTNASPYTFMMAGDFYWMLSSGSGYWKNPSDGKLEVLPVDRPGTNIPEEQHYNEYTCNGQNIPDSTIATDYLNFVGTNGLPAYNYVELFNDHPGTYQDIAGNDTATNQIVTSLMGNPSYKDNTVIIVTEDDTQNGSNGTDHVSNTYRVPLVVVGSPTYVKQHYLSHVAYTTSNVLAAMERVMQNVKPGAIDSNGNLGLTTFPMTTNDQSALGDPLEDFWIQGSTPLSASATGNPTSGNAPLTTAFTASATGGTAPYTYSWNFGDGSAASPTQNPSHTYSSAGSFTATVTVTDSSSPAKFSTASVPISVSAVGGPLTGTATATPTSGQTPLNVAFTGSGSGGTPPYSYSWNFGDGSATTTTQNPSHTYTAAGTYTATLTVTDSSSPAQSVSATVTITASPVAGTPPGAPTGLAATPGNGQVTLNWTAPSSNGGVNITSYKVYRGTSSGTETALTSGGCSGLGAVLTCTDTGLTNGQTYFYDVTAVNALGEGPPSNEASTTPVSVNLLGNPGFENGSGNPAPWTATSGVISNNSKEPPHSGTWDAWMCGYGTTHTDTLSQQVSIPNASSATLSFWRHIDTAETGTTAHDTMTVQVLNSSGTVLSTLHTYSNLDHNAGYVQDTYDLSPYTGQTVNLKFSCSENSSLQTSFVIDDTSLTTVGSPPPPTTTTTAPTTTVPSTTTTTVPSTTTTTVPSGTNLLGNPGFENGTNSAPWTATSGVINNSSSEPPHSGSWDAWLDGYGTTHTDTLAQTVAIPSASSATLSFWLHIDTAETTTTTAYDTLTLQVLNSSGAVLATLHTWSNLNHNTGYSQQTLDMSSFVGQTVTLKFTGTEDYTRQTSFVIDDTSLTTH